MEDIDSYILEVYHENITPNKIFEVDVVQKWWSSIRIDIWLYILNSKLLNLHEYGDPAFVVLYDDGKAVCPEELKDVKEKSYVACMNGYGRVYSKAWIGNFPKVIIFE